MGDKMDYNYSIIETPLGNLSILADNESLKILKFSDSLQSFEKKFPMPKILRKKNLVLQNAEKQIQEYFRKERKIFDIPLDISLGTTFQQTVWNSLIDIGYGSLASYADIARKINHPNAYRAVGNANNSNPISIIIPCHRVVGSNGNLSGYGGGIDKKKFLIDLEEEHD
jgi:methylated-DNA-[protein]-cysteine S-methyltransferase